LGQILVKVRIKSTDDDGKPTLTNGVETVITYKSYNLTADRYDLLYQCDEKGNEIAGNPNLGAQHRTAQRQSVAAPVANPGPSQREKDLERQLQEMRELVEKLTAPKADAPAPETKAEPSPPAPNRPGRKKSTTTEIVA
jgi:hypothetical protein